MQFINFLTIVSIFTFINTVFGDYLNTTDTELTTTVTSRITMYITMGDETYTVLKTPLAPIYTAANATGVSNETAFSTGSMTGLRSVYVSQTSLYNSTSA
ncbi:hypothetical protein FOG51_00709 [Hanseniaspora uvarum]|jgi:hypothetical protein|uniref:Uncharacterized protein n=1 Tax=Hanseniaspora uvarum TaxID=29833 RepID=A0A1E5RIK9_HANUV|nr:hypothetical protein FOG48_01717 [Hanseniaspora uvarum]KAF0274335.1 hypothetical protein FOG51_00709 [Hanseniaspora uvarum]KAF0276464.1 hypothetical protein FOG50_02685 [Hanseniaspora uvarum]OEJ86705.1 hypothetical protein AWRI3580_g3121 [Hanseniaspora uvarum]